ncbi:MAG: hypothetical protein HC924_09890 [Synechococcaceae cyanobacterium SM2_3_2]|nr:hypothetical protein [Synechococcaceae cyanobacterium SM2_3_2]
MSATDHRDVPATGWRISAIYLRLNRLPHRIPVPHLWSDPSPLRILHFTLSVVRLAPILLTAT